MVIRLFHQRFQVLISEGKASPSIPDSVISALIHIDPLQTMGTGDLGFLWITEILNSGYEEYWRYEMASGVVELLRKHFRSEITKYPLDMQPAWMQPAWMPPILGFLSLCEKFYATGLPLDSAPVAFRILSTSPGSADLCTTILPVLTSTLLPTHPLRARSLALKVFVRWRSGWFSSQMETVLHKDLNKFLQAISDPFQFATGLPPQDGKPAVATYSEPTITAIVLIESHRRICGGTTSAARTSLPLKRPHPRKEGGESFSPACCVWQPRHGRGSFARPQRLLQPSGALKSFSARTPLKS